MVNGSVGMSGRSFDAFVSSQRAHNEPDWAAKIQEKYWRARQKFLARIERKEDSCVVLSDAKLDSKLEIYRSIDRSCERLTELLESYQNCLFVFANEENALGILLKECGKHDRTKAGKIMALTGKSLTQSSHQRIRLYMPLLRLYQEMETFHSRAVEDTSKTVDKLETRRAQYRSSLLWMKNISENLDPDVYRQLDKFRRVQNKVRDDKKAFDSMQMDVVQKIDLLMASRCNLINQILASYQSVLLETFEKNYNNFKSVEEIIRGEDLYEYEFKTLKHLNPLRISDEDEPTHDGRSSEGQAAGERGDTNKVEEGELIGHLGDEPANDGNNNDLPPSGQTSSGLIDVNEPLNEAQARRLAEAARARADSLVSIHEAQEDELTNSLDLLDSLFGSRHDASGMEEGAVAAGSGKSRKREEDLKVLRSNLNANLLDFDAGDEAKQVASLLGLSERASSSQQRTKNEAQVGGAGAAAKAADPLGLQMQEDIFSKWDREADNSKGDKASQFKAPAESSLMDQDLMDIGGATMPKRSGDLDDFLA